MTIGKTHPCLLSAEYLKKVRLKITSRTFLLVVIFWPCGPWIPNLRTAFLLQVHHLCHQFLQWQFPFSLYYDFIFFLFTNSDRATLWVIDWWVIFVSPRHKGLEYLDFRNTNGCYASLRFRVSEYSKVQYILLFQLNKHFSISVMQMTHYWC